MARPAHALAPIWRSAGGAPFWRGRISILLAEWLLLNEPFFGGSERPEWGSVPEVIRRVAQMGILVEAPKWRGSRPLSPFKTARWRAMSWRRRLAPAAAGDVGRFGDLAER